jgi:hypothetical protein
MSKVSLQGNISGSGTLTIAAPNTNSNYTLTLPAESGTLITSGGAIDVSASAPADSLVLDSSGNLGIGTSSPTQKLSVFVSGGGAWGGFGDSVTTASNPNLFGSDGTGAAAIYTPAAYPIKFYTNTTERARIDSSGNVGIGTSSPGQKLSVATASGNCYVDVARASKSTGQVALQLSGGTSGTNWIIYQPTNSDNLTFFGNSADRMVLDSSGNLGLGVTPSAWSGVKALEIQSGGAGGGALYGSSNITLGCNHYYDGNWKYKSDGYATAYYQQYGGLGSVTSHVWLIAPSGTAGNAISFTQAMTLDASGNLGVGTTSPASRTHIAGPMVVPAGNFKSVLTVESTDSQAANTGGGITLGGVFTGTSRTSFAQIAGIKENSTDNNYAGALTFYTRPNGDTLAERARIDSSGYLLVGHADSAALSGKPAGVIAPIGYVGRSGTTGSFANVFNIYWTGSPVLYIDSTNVGTISTTSDYRTKRNIETQTQEALSRIAQLRPVTYQRADYGTLFQEDDNLREGFIAHELAEVIPSAVEGEKDAENQIQSLKLDALCSVLVKAIQELKAENDVLKARLDAAGL